MDNPIIISNKDTKEYFFKEGCFVLELSNSEVDEDLSIAKIRVSPSKQTKWHSLNNQIERYVIISGIGEVEVGKHKQVVETDDVVIIPKNCRQRIKNLSTSDLVFYAICNPRFKPENYLEIEE
jgi:mannose-6-phosphate isomerase-like protein (cupin superfamily)